MRQKETHFSQSKVWELTAHPLLHKGALSNVTTSQTSGVSSLTYPKHARVGWKVTTAGVTIRCCRWAGQANYDFVWQLLYNMPAKTDL